MGVRASVCVGRGMLMGRRCLLLFWGLGGVGVVVLDELDCVFLFDSVRWFGGVIRLQMVDLLILHVEVAVVLSSV